MAKANIWQWSETPASNSEIDGIDISGATGKVKDGDNAIREMMAQLIEMEGKGSDVASAGTLTLGTERYYHVTGTTTITDIDFTDAVDGRWAILIFDGALTLTHNATTLKLPGNGNIVTEAGDRALFVQDSSDNVICIFYQRASQVPYVTGTGTPGLTFGGGSTGMTFGTRSFSYTKIGRTVFGRGTLTLTAKGSSTGSAVITGLPFTSETNAAALGNFIIISYSNMASLSFPPMGFVSSNATTASLLQGGAASNVALSHASFTDTTSIFFTFQYDAAS